MKTNVAWLGALLLTGHLSVFAQDKRPVQLEEVIRLAAKNSTESKIADTKIISKQLELAVAKNSYLPDFKLSGTYNRLTDANVNMKMNTGSSSGSTEGLSVDQMILGSATASQPLFTGFKIKNSVAAAENAVKLEEYMALNTKEKLAKQAIQLYLSLYKAQQTELLIAENIKRYEQQVKDFKSMEENGLIARNDLLKAQLQLSNYEVSKQEAHKNVAILNYQLVNFLKLNEGTEIAQIDLAQVVDPTVTANEALALANRNDMKAIQVQGDIAENQVKVAKAAYYPSVAVNAGYTAFDVRNVITVHNAVNVGLGVSYDIASLYKNKKNVNLAKQRILEVSENRDLLTDQIKVQVQQADENLKLALAQEKVYAQAVDQATENYRIVKDKYENGVADTDDLLEADVQQLQTLINQQIAKANTVEKFYDVRLANGQLTLNN